MKWSDIILHKSRQMSLVNSGALITLHAVKMHVSVQLPVNNPPLFENHMCWHKMALFFNFIELIEIIIN